VEDARLSVKLPRLCHKSEIRKAFFFSPCFSSSNHDPKSFPDNKIELYNNGKTREKMPSNTQIMLLAHFFKLASKKIIGRIP